MPPHQVLLLAELRGISAATKLFLVKLLQRFPDKTSFHFGVKALASELAVTDRVVTNALNELVALDYLVRSVSITGRGRPTPTYCMGGAYEKVIKADLRERQLAQGLLVDRVLESRHSDKIEGLSSSNRLLLAVLLGHSDRVGSVIGLGRSRLCRLTGLTSSSVLRQLKKLLALKSIRAVARGVMASDMFGVVPSTFFLNLQNPTRCVVGEPANFFTYTFVRDSTLYVSGFMTRYPADRILLIGDRYRRQMDSKTYEHIWYEARNTLPDLVRIKEVSTLLEDKRVSWKRLSVILQSRLDEYASFLLSHHWKRLAFETYTTDPVLVDKIKCHLRSSSDEIGTTKGGTTSRQQDLALLLHDASVRWARWVQQMMEWVVGIPYERMDHVILPSTNKLGWILKLVILSYSDSSDTPLGCYELSVAPGETQSICKLKGQDAAI